MSPTFRVAALAALLMACGAACSDDGPEVAVGGAGATSTNASGAAGMGGSGGDGMCLAFGDSCGANDTCCDAAGVTGECYPFGMGPRCSIPCPANPADCPNEGQGCNAMSPAYCKPP